MSQRFFTIGKLTSVRPGDGGIWTLTVENHHGDTVTFTTPFTPPPAGSAFEIRVVECGDFYGTG